MKRKKKLRLNVAIFFATLFIMLLGIFLMQYIRTTGKAISSTEETYVNDFDSGSNTRDIYEEGLNKTFRGQKLAPGSSITITPDRKIEDILSSEQGEIWMRIKLTNSEYSQQEYLPFMYLGGLSLFKGSAEEDPDTATIKNGNDIYIGIWNFYRKLATFSLNEWHEILISWKMGWPDDECGSGSFTTFSVYIDSSPQPVYSIENDPYTIEECDEYFPFQSSELRKTILMPSFEQMESIVRSQVRKDATAVPKSGFFIDKFVLSKKQFNDFMAYLSNEAITNVITPYWSGLSTSEVTIPKAPSDGTIIIPNTAQKCKVWNKNKVEQGNIRLPTDDYGKFRIGLRNNGLVILNPEPNLEDMRIIEIECSYQDKSVPAEIPLTIGNPQIFDFRFTQNNAKELNISIDKNSEKIIEYYAQKVFGAGLNIAHTLVSTTGKITQTEKLEPVGSTYQWKIISGSQLGEDKLILNITDGTTGKSLLADINVKITENTKPEIYEYSPQNSNIEIAQGSSAYFTAKIRDDRTPEESLMTSWSIDGEEKVYARKSKSFEFGTNEQPMPKTYIIKLEVSDGLLSSYQTWHVAVKKISINNTNDSNPYRTNYTAPPAVCGNNVWEPGEECDGNQNSQCHYAPCLPNCTCPVLTINQTQNNSQCVPSWFCTEWSVCQNSSHSRVCNDFNLCNNLTNRPPLQEQCQENTLGENTQNQQGNNPDNNLNEENQEENKITPENAPQENTQISKSKEEAGTVQPEGDNAPKEMPSKNPLLSALLWILIAIIIIPFIIIGAKKFSESKQGSQQQLAPQQSSQASNYPYYPKLLETVEWYKERGMPPNQIYGMLSRMGFDSQQISNAIYEKFHMQK